MTPFQKSLSSFDPHPRLHFFSAWPIPFDGSAGGGGGSENSNGSSSMLTESFLPASSDGAMKATAAGLQQTAQSLHGSDSDGVGWGGHIGAPSAMFRFLTRQESFCTPMELPKALPSLRSTSVPPSSSLLCRGTY
jgi:hypothetical protein